MKTNIPLLYYKYLGKYDNFGDKLSQVIVKKLTKNKISTTNNLNYSGQKLIGIGSLLNIAKNNDILWGTGVRKLDYDHNFNNLHVACVRGPITRNILIKKKIKCPEIYGDPSLTFKNLFPKYKRNNMKKIGFVPHLTQINFYKNKYKGITMISPLENYKYVANEILKCEYIISSSLHGLIFADLYDIPAYWLYEKELNEGKLKFYDYNMSQNIVRKQFNSIDEILKSNLSETNINKINSTKILKSFPHHLINPNNQFYQLN